MQARTARVVLAAAVAIVVGYVIAAWTPGGVPSDFAAQYVGGTLLREGHAAELYNVAAQAAVRRQVLPASAGNLEYVHSPPVAAAVAPLTLLGAHDAFRLWSVAQLLMVVAAVVIAARAAPRVTGRDARVRLLAIGATACAGFGTAVLLALGQIDGVQALGVALAYSQWRRGHYGWGGFWLAVTAATGKPQLALGLAALLVGWRDRRALFGAASGVVAALAGCLVIAGPSGTAAFVGASVSQFGAWHLATMPALVGLAGSWLGDTAAAHALGAAGSVVAIAVAFDLGRRVRSDTSLIAPALVAAAVLSQLAAPHTYAYDLALLAPVATMAMATAAWRDSADPRLGWSRLATVGTLWLAINIGAYVDSADAAHAPPGQLTAWMLLGAAAVAIRAAGGVRGRAATWRSTARVRSPQLPRWGAEPAEAELTSPR